MEEVYIMKIRKRNGELVEFIPGKIKSALEKAFVRCAGHGTNSVGVKPTTGIYHQV